MRTLFLAVLALFIGLAQPVSSASPEAPFGDKVSAAIPYYNRATPQIASAGQFQPGAATEIKALGFKAVLNLRGPKEGEARDRAALEAAGLKYLNIPVLTRAPTLEQVKAFAVVAKDAGNYPLLVYCKTANRVGAMWAMYRYADGVPFAVAIDEGRTLGLKPNREGAVRKTLGQPPLAQGQ